MSFEWLFGPVEHADEWLAGFFDGAPLLVALLIAFVLGLWHASDPDHLVAVTSLMASDQADTRAAARLGAWWGTGHAVTLIVIGAPLIVFKTELPATLESGAEKAVGVVILVLAARVIFKWMRGDYRSAPHEHRRPGPACARPAPLPGLGRPLTHPAARTPTQAFAIGTLHGLAGTGAIVLLLVAALPTRLEAAAALAVFAPMSVISMAGVHQRLRLDPHPAPHRAAVPRSADPGPRRLRGLLRPLVRGPDLSVPARLRFRCQFCGAVPDAATHASLVEQVRAQLFGEYLEAMPGAWLTWTGHGVCGPARYACFDHQNDLMRYVRKHYGTVAWNAKRTRAVPAPRAARAPKPGPGRPGYAGLPRW